LAAGSYVFEPRIQPHIAQVEQPGTAPLHPSDELKQRLSEPLAALGRDSNCAWLAEYQCMSLLLFVSILQNLPFVLWDCQQRVSL